MTLYLFLKNARERCNMTQEALAEKIGVSITTIQNWEKETLPDKNHWPAILEQLNLSREEFFEHYENTALPDAEEGSVPSFPDFLFPDNMVSQIKMMKLTADEQELLGLEELYSATYNMDGAYEFTVTKTGSLPTLPYEYVRRVGAFHIMNLSDSSHKKIGEHRNYVIAQIKTNPEKLFDVFKCSAVQLLHLCDEIEVDYYNDCRHHHYNLGTELRNTIKLLECIADADNSLVIAEADKNYWPSYWRERDNYSSFAKNIESHSEQWMKIVEKESENPDYLEAKEKYEKDKRFYEEHASMMDHAPVPPEYHGTKNVEMTERGQQLLAWYKENIK